MLPSRRTVEHTYEPQVAVLATEMTGSRPRLSRGRGGGIIVLIDEILRATRLGHRADDAILAHPPAASSRVCSLADASRSSGVAVTRGHEPLVLPRPYQV